MRNYFFGLLVIISAVTLNAENYFQNGMVWNEILYNDADPLADDYNVKYWIDGDTIYNGEKALKLYYQIDEKPVSLCTVLKVEGEQVFYIHNQGSTEWRLMYDFGLVENEECYISWPHESWNNGFTPTINRVVCTSVTANEAYPGFEVINFNEYTTRPTSTYEATGYWIKGLGSPLGLLHTICFDYEGGGGSLVSAYLNGVQVYPDPSGVASAQDNTPALCVKAEDKTLVISGIDTGSALAVCTSDGKVVSSVANPSSSLRVRIPSNGVYIISNGSRTVKTVVN